MQYSDLNTPMMLDARWPWLSFGATFITHQRGRRKLANSLMRTHELRYRELIAALPIGVLVHGASSEVLMSNSAAQNMLGLTEEQLIGKSSFSLDWQGIHEDGTMFPGATHPVPQAVASCKTVSNVVMGLLRPDTRERVWLLVNATPQLNPDGSVAQVVCVIADITGRIASEEAMRLANRKLESTRLY